MLNKIRLLPEELINQIAAGEVVERPASVVKELVENSIDAGATIILIKVSGGGRRLIEVADNGCGMSNDDALLALERHATSKIRKKDDLGRIRTLGFRGEAIASIAAVSHMKLTTSLPESIAGCQMEVAGGRLKSVKEIGAPGGTVIEIRNLFYNIPARLKFLKTQATELSHINQVVTKLALAYPTIHFKLTCQNKEVFDLSPQLAVRERIADLFGVKTARQLLVVDYQEEGLRVEGLIGPPVLQRSGRDYQYIFINHRAVQNKTIAQAANSAYRQLLPQKRHPVWFLFLKTDPRELDVNVHPAKLEVRFKNHFQIYQLVENGLKQTLRATALAPRIELEKPVEPKEELPLRDNAYTSRIQRAIGKYDLAGQSKLAFEKKYQPSNPPGEKPITSASLQEKTKSPYTAKETSPQKSAPIEYRPEKQEDFWREITPIGQLGQTYLLCQNKQELIIIDQHAAHERVTYERLLKALKKQARMESQRLLFPLQLHITPRQQPLLEEEIPFLEKLGFELAMFGDNTLIIQAAPPFLTNEQVIPCLEDILDKLVNSGRTPDAAKIKDSLLQRIACHASIRANQALPAEEIRALLAQLSQLESPFTCPHGRPTTIRFAISELAKRFKRT